MLRNVSAPREQVHSVAASPLIHPTQKKFMKAMKRFPSVLRAQYALALLFEKNADKAEMIKNEFEKVAKTYPYAQDIESERDLMKIAESK